MAPVLQGGTEGFESVLLPDDNDSCDVMFVLGPDSGLWFCLEMLPMHKGVKFHSF